MREADGGKGRRGTSNGSPEKRGDTALRRAVGKLSLVIAALINHITAPDSAAHLPNPTHFSLPTLPSKHKNSKYFSHSILEHFCKFSDERFGGFFGFFFF